VRPIAPKRYEIRFTASAEMRDRLREAQDLLGHAVPSGDIAEVFDRALIELVSNLKKRKFAATAKPRPRHRAQPGHPANVTADVKRAVARCPPPDASRHAYLGKTSQVGAQGDPSVRTGSRPARGSAAGLSCRSPSFGGSVVSRAGVTAIEIDAAIAARQGVAIRRAVAPLPQEQLEIGGR